MNKFNNQIPNKKKGVLFFLLGALFVSASYILSKYQIDFNRFTELGYVGIFCATFIGSATIFFPIPNVATVIAAGFFFNPVGVAISAGLGATMGESVGYFVGKSGENSVYANKWYHRIVKWVESYGFITILLLAFIPNPFFDIAGLVAGMSQYPLIKFLLATLIGKTLRSLLLALISSQIA